MQIWPWFMKAPNAAAATAASISASSSTIIGALPPSSSKRRLEIFRRDLRDDAADPRRAGEIDPAHGGMADQHFDQGRGVFRRVGDDVEDARRQAGVAQAFGDQPMRARADFGGLQHHGVAAGQRQRDGADAEDDRRVPRRHAQHHARGLANGHGDAARLVRGDDFAGNLRGHGGRLAQHAGGEVDVEAGPAGGRPGFGRHQLDELRGLRRQKIGGFQQDRAPGIRAGGGPGREGGCGGVGRPLRIRDLGCRGAACDVTGDGVEAIERSAVRRRNILALEQQRDFVHGFLSSSVALR